MVIGLPLGLFLRSRVFRWIHFVGMFVTALIAAVNVYCPLTIWEEILRWDSEHEFTQRGNFLAHHLSNVLYPDLEPWIIRTGTVFWGVATLLAMILVPPGRHTDQDK
jgi:hypothetical protein